MSKIGENEREYEFVPLSNPGEVAPIEAPAQPVRVPEEVPA